MEQEWKNENEEIDNMTESELEELYKEYEEYCKHDGKKMYHLPFIIWLKQVKNRRK